MIILTIESFEGFYSLSTSIDTDPILQAYIDRFEEEFIKRILGVELGQLFIDDITGSDSSDVEARFQVLLDPFTKQDSCDRILSSKGFESILAGMVYSEFIGDDQLKHSQSGMIKNKAEVSGVISVEDAVRYGEQKWNESLISIIAVQWYCGSEAASTYPEYRGTYIRPQYSNLL